MSIQNSLPSLNSKSNLYPSNFTLLTSTIYYANNLDVQFGNKQIILGTITPNKSNAIVSYEKIEFSNYSKIRITCDVIKTGIRHYFYCCTVSSKSATSVPVDAELVDIFANGENQIEVECDKFATNYLLIYHSIAQSGSGEEIIKIKKIEFIK